MTTEELEAKILEQEGALKVATATVDEFRNTNITLAKSVDELNTKYKSDMEGYDALKKIEQEAKDKKMISEGKVDELVEQKVKTFRTDQIAKIKELQENSNNLNAQLNAQVVGNSVKTIAIKAGVVASAIDDVVMRANSMWTAKDGKPVAMNKDGSVIWIEGTTEPLTLEKWMESLSTTAPHLFGKSTGTGAVNTDPANVGGGKTISREAFDALGQNEKHSFFKDGGKLV